MFTFHLPLLFVFVFAVFICSVCYLLSSIMHLFMFSICLALFFTATNSSVLLEHTCAMARELVLYSKILTNDLTKYWQFHRSPQHALQSVWIRHYGLQGLEDAGGPFHAKCRQCRIINPPILYFSYLSVWRFSAW